MTGARGDGVAFRARGLFAPRHIRRCRHIERPLALDDVDGGCACPRGVWRKHRRGRCQLPAEAATAAGRAQDHGPVRLRSRRGELCRHAAGAGHVPAALVRPVPQPRPDAREPARRHRQPGGRDVRPADPRAAFHLPVAARPRMGVCRLPVAAGVARPRQRARRARGTLHGVSRHQRTELRRTALARQYRRASEDQQSAQLPLRRRLGHRARGHQPPRPDLPRARFLGAMAGDQVRACHQLRRRPQGPVPACRDDPAAQAHARPRPQQRCARADARLQRRAIRQPRAGLHDRERASRALADPGVPCADRRPRPRRP